MAKAADEMDLRSLAGEIVQDFGRLLGQQMDLLRAEVGQQFGRAERGAWLAAAGAGLAASGGLLTGLASAHLLRRATGLPLWLCYAGAAGAGGAAGAALMRAAGREIGNVQLLPPPETAAAVRENVAWLQDQLSPAAR